MRKAAAGFIVLAVLWGFFGFFSSPAFAEKEYINGIDANFPPFAFVDKEGKPDGFDVAVVNWIAQEMGFKVKHQPMDWDTIVPSLKANKIDFIASGLSINDARKKEVDFTSPYWIVKHVLVAKGDSTLTTETALVEGKKIGTQRGTSEAKWVDDNLLKKQGMKFELIYYDSAPLAIEDVINGRIAAAAIDDAPAEDAVRKKPVKIIGGFYMPDESFAYATRKEDTELLKKLDEGLKKIQASPKWEELKKKYQL